ncbi:YhgE/Pip family protein [Nocardiopsis coralliicola]
MAPRGRPRILGVGRVAWLSVRSWFRHPLLIAALAALAVIPLLYTGMYLWAFWDPFGRIDHLPVALVDEDEPAEAEGETVDAGRQLTDRLTERGDLAWKVTGAEDASEGVADGRYYAAITIPEDFSADLVSPADTGRDPTPATLQVHFNDATNYIATELLSMGFREIEQAVAETAAAKYFDTLFIGFDEIHSETEEAAEGAGELADGAGSAKDGSSELAGGLGDAEDGADELSSGVDSAAEGADELAGGAASAHGGAGELAGGLSGAEEGAAELSGGAGSAHDGAGALLSGLEDAEAGADSLESGLSSLATGSQTLASGAGSASEQVAAKTDELNALADEWIPLLRERGPGIADGAHTVAEASGGLADALDTLPELGAEEAAVLSGLSARLAAYQEARPGLAAEDPELYALVRDAQWAADRAVALDSYVQQHRGTLRGMAADARSVRDLANELSEAAPHLADDAEDARSQVNELNDGLAELAEGSAELRDGIDTAHGGAADLDSGLDALVNGAEELDTGLGTLAGGANELESGLAELHGGAVELDSGLGTLSEGADELDTGLGTLSGGAGALDEGVAQLRIGADDLDDGVGKLQSGSDELAGALSDGADRIPVFDPDQRAARADMMSSPAQLAEEHDNRVPDYGTGFAPFFLGLSLWVGAMVAYMVLPPASGRALASSAASWRVAAAGWLPVAVLGAVQAAVMAGALHLLLGLESVNWPGLIGFLALGAAAYTAIVHWVDLQFGAPGKVIVLVLLILQITSAGGTYPLQTSPGFFQAIAPFAPMYWVVTGARHLISGGNTGVVLLGCLVLAAFTAGALLLSWAACAGKRTWTMGRLHPVLNL